MTRTTDAESEIDVRLLCAALRQRGYLVPYTVMLKSMLDALAAKETQNDR